MMDETRINTLRLLIKILWFMFWMWIGEKIEDKYNIFPLVTVMLGGFVLPAIIFGILLLI